MKLNVGFAILAILGCTAVIGGSVEDETRKEDEKEQRAKMEDNKMQRWGEIEGARLLDGNDARDAKDVQKFFAEFYNSDRMCVSPEASLSGRSRGKGEGIGSQLNGYMISAMWALLNGKRLCSHESRSIYINAKTCPSQSWDCLFEEISPRCPCSQLKGKEVGKIAPQNCVLNFGKKSSTVLSSISNGMGYTIFEKLSTFKKDLPPRTDHWYMSQLYFYFLRPNHELKNYVEKTKAAFLPGWNPAKTISAHIRRGDHWMGVHLDDSDYIYTIKMVVSFTGADTVLLGSDDISVLKSYPDLLQPIRVVSLPFNQSILGKHAEECNGRNQACRAAKFLQESSSSDEGKFLMAQIYLMSETLVTIGTIGSNFGRVIHQLQWASKALTNSHTSPNLHFLDMSGDSYFMCGWRMSRHVARPNRDVVQEWCHRYSYFVNQASKY